ncbi:hypothetical protein [uncultured Alsobacter sp.]|uniref:hypothetical protein n=1 Tax=uncultured Alsobacter sp. TaxID=1748258 RepID=UPI0025E510EE|nr:hypothetical protein [uncultured Alsobacter sp.]
MKQLGMEARGTQLLAELKDLIERMWLLQPREQAYAMYYLERLISTVDDQYGGVSELSSQQTKDLSEELRTTATTFGGRDPGRGYAMALCSLYVESHHVPGPDAAAVRVTLTTTIDDLRKAAKDEATYVRLH